MRNLRPSSPSSLPQPPISALLTPSRKPHTRPAQSPLSESQSRLGEGLIALTDSQSRLEALSAVGLEHHQQLLDGQGALLSSAASTASALAGVAAQTTTIEAGVANSLLLERELLELQLEANASLGSLADAQRDAAVRTLAHLQARRRTH